MSDDSIFGVATPPGRSALAVVRVDGPAARDLVGTALPHPVEAVPRRAHYGPYRATDGTLIDRVVYVRFYQPASYTGSDLLEISLHGNPLLVRKLTDDLRQRGVREAEPGEFTRRAFLAGKIDLSQAEAVADLIEARSEAALAAADRQLSGGLGAEIDEVIRDLLGIRAEVEAYLDFPEEDLPPGDEAGPAGRMHALRARMARMVETGRLRELLHDGIRVLIVGPPNAGKSSLLNFLLGEERAIVDEQPGTTRDFIEDSFVLGPWRIRIVDTAGLHEACDPIERQGVARTLRLAETADYFLLVADGGAPSPTLPPGLLVRMNPSNTFCLVNKADAEPFHRGRSSPIGGPVREVSVRTREGMDGFLQAWEAHLSEDLLQGASDRILYNERHISLLRESLSRLDAAIELLAENADSLLVAVELREAVEVLGRITGGVDNEAMLDVLFSRFCIGK